MEDRERVFTAKKNREKEFATRKTLVRRFVVWTAILVVLIVVYFAVGPLNRAIALSTANPTPSERFAVINGGDIEIFSDKAQTLPISTPGSNPDAPMLAAQKADEIAFSAKGSMTVTVYSKGEKTSIAVPNQFGEQDQIVRLTPAPIGFYAVVQDMSDTASVRATNRPTRTVQVTGESSPLTVFEDGMMCASADGQKSVTRTKEGVFALVSAGSGQDLITLPESIIWDFDFGQDVLVAAEEATLHIVKGGKKKTLVPAFFHKIIEVKAVPSLQQVWVSVTKPGGSSAVMAFDYAGKFVGTKLVRKGEIRVPYLEANQAVMDLVQGAEAS